MGTFLYWSALGALALVIGAYFVVPSEQVKAGALTCVDKQAGALASGSLAVQKEADDYCKLHEAQRASFAQAIAKRDESHKM